MPPNYSDNLAEFREIIQIISLNYSDNSANLFRYFLQIIQIIFPNSSDIVQIIQIIWLSLEKLFR